MSVVLPAIFICKYAIGRIVVKEVNPSINYKEGVAVSKVMKVLEEKIM